MSIEDSIVCRVYKCDNIECKAEMAYEQPALEKWKERCPCCKKNTLVMDKAHLNISIFIDNTIPKTFGGQSDVNIRNAEKEGTLPIQKKTPYWRKNKKRIDYKILKNPESYIKTGII